MYPKCMTICGSFEILFLQHFFIWSYKAVIDSLVHLFNKNLKTKERRMLARIFFSDSYLYLVSMKTHECYFAYLTYLIITASNPDKRTLRKLYSHAARITI